MVVNKLLGGPKEGGEQSHVVSPEWEDGSMCMAAPRGAVVADFRPAIPNPSKISTSPFWERLKNHLGGGLGWALVELLAAVSATAVQPL